MMLEEMLKTGNSEHKFQVLFLRNDSSQEVEVQEACGVDFQAIQERLEKGESVFITSRSPQKIKPLQPLKRSAVGQRSMKTKLATVFYLDHI